MILKSEKEIKIMREGGQILASVLQEVLLRAVVGANLDELDKLAEELILKKGGKPSFKNYRPPGAGEPYPSSLCVSLNDEIVHGLSFGRELKDGDVASFDLGVFYGGFHTDSATTVAIGAAGKKDLELLSVTKEALEAAIKKVKPGFKTGDLGHEIESFIGNYGYRVIKSLSGHGIGRSVHEHPDVPNFGRKGEGIALEEGAVIAIEPMATAGSDNIYLAEDGFTYKTSDGSKTAHFEHTVAVTKGGCEVLTKI